MIKSVFGYDVKYPCEYLDVYSTLQCYIREKIPLPSEWSEKYDQLLKRIACYYFNLVNSYEDMLNPYTQELLGYIDALISAQDVDLVYMSSHDTVLLPIALRLCGHAVKIPDYCSHIKFEIWENSIKIFYDDELLLEKSRPLTLASIKYSMKPLV